MLIYGQIISDVVMIQFVTKGEGPMTAIKTSLLAALLTLVIMPANAITVQYDLDAAGDQATINGAIFYREDPRPTGTGTINSFLRIQAKDVEQGYNTDVDNIHDFQFDEKGGEFTHSLLLGEVGKVSFDNGQTYYREFMLDCSESDKALILTDLKLYLEPVGNLLNWPDSFGTPLYDMDTPLVDNQVSLVINPGNGRGDMYLYVPDSLFSDTDPYVYLYSRFTQCDSSFEEWSTQDTPEDNTVVPEPMTLSLLGLGLGLGALVRRRTIR